MSSAADEKKANPQQERMKACNTQAGDKKGDVPPLDRLTEYEAIRLFVDRAVAVKLDFTLTDDTASAVVQICQQLLEQASAHACEQQLTDLPAW